MPRAATEDPKPAKPKRSRIRKPATPADIRLTGDRIVVRVPGNGERKSASGLLIPATAAPAPRKLVWADVELTGPDVRVAERGDRVLFLPSSGLEVELGGEDLVLLRERDVQAVAPGADGSEAKARQPGQYL
jgi:chaperonin GroES